MSPGEIIRRQAEAGAQRAQERATHVWPRAKQRVTPPAPPPPPEPPADQPVRTPPVTPVTRDMTFNPDQNVIDVTPTVTIDVTPVATAQKPVAPASIADKILHALNQRAGAWFTPHELSIMTSIPRASLSTVLARLVERYPNDVQRVADGKRTYRYRLINSLPKRGKK